MERIQIKTLKDLKLILSDIPNHILDKLGAGIDFDNLEQVCLLCSGIKENETIQFYSDISEKYPGLNEIEKWIINISRESIDFDNGESNLRSLEGFITS